MRGIIDGSRPFSLDTLFAQRLNHLEAVETDKAQKSKNRKYKADMERRQREKAAMTDLSRGVITQAKEEANARQVARLSEAVRDAALGIPASGGGLRPSGGGGRVETARPASRQQRSRPSSAPSQRQSHRGIPAMPNRGSRRVTPAPLPAPTHAGAGSGPVASVGTGSGGSRPGSARPTSASPGRGRVPTPLGSLGGGSRGRIGPAAADRPGRGTPPMAAPAAAWGSRPASRAGSGSRSRG